MSTKPSRELVGDSRGGELEVRLVVAYKLGKAAVQLVGAAVLLAMLAGGLGDRLHELLVRMRVHATEAWSARLARWLLRQATPHRERIMTLALGLDGLLSAFEGYALHRRLPWARLLVVGLTAMLLPIEVYEIVRAPGVARLVLLLANALVVVALGLRARRAER